MSTAAAGTECAKRRPRRQGRRCVRCGWARDCTGFRSPIFWRSWGRRARSRCLWRRRLWAGWCTTAATSSPRSACAGCWTCRDREGAAGHAGARERGRPVRAAGRLGGRGPDSVFGGFRAQSVDRERAQAALFAGAYKLKDGLMVMLDPERLDPMRLARGGVRGNGRCAR